MNTKLKVMLASTTLTIALLSGCAIGVGNRSQPDHTHSAVTPGQELIDLKAALDSGAITPTEYESERRKVLDRE